MKKSRLRGTFYWNNHKRKEGENAVLINGKKGCPKTLFALSKRQGG
jgi:hypothetical protein